MSSTPLDNILDMTSRLQLNLRLDGKEELLKTIKAMAAAEGLSMNAWVVQTLEQAAIGNLGQPPAKQKPSSPITDIEPELDTLLDSMLDKKLAAKLAPIEERLGKLSA